MSHDMMRETRTDQDDRTVGELVNDASAQLSRLVRDEIQLAAAELRQKRTQVGVGAGLMSGAGLLAAYGVATLLVAAVLAIAIVLPAWLSALIVGAVLLLFSGALVLAGKAQLKRGTPPIPEQAMASTRRDVEAVRKGAHR